MDTEHADLELVLLADVIRGGAGGFDRRALCNENRLRTVHPVVRQNAVLPTRLARELIERIGQRARDG